MTAASRQTAAPWPARWKAELVIVGVALALRLGLFLAVGAWDPPRLEKRIFVGDAREYHRLAINLVEHGVYSSDRRPPLQPDTFRVPLYPGYLAPFYGLFGPRPFLPILAQLLLSALTCAVVCRTGTVLFGRRTGIVAGVVLAVDYSSVLFANRLYSDTLFTLLVALGVHAIARFSADGGARFMAAAGVALGLATLTRPVSLYLVIALAPVVWLGVRRRPRLALARWGLLAAIYLLTLAPWMLRNYLVTGRPYVTSIQTMVGSWYLPKTFPAPEDAATVAARATPSWRRLIDDGAGFARGFVRYFAVLGSGEVPLILGRPYQRHDAYALRDASLRGWIESTLRNRSSPFERAVVVSIVAWLALLYLAAARGLWRAARRRQWLEATLLVVTIGYFMVATGPIAREIRYRLPALPAIVVLAGAGLASRRSAADELSAQSSRRSPASSSRSAA